MSEYESFASVYDFLMRDIDYYNWLLYIQKIWKRRKQDVNLVLDLGCGTGSLSVLLAREGYDVIGVDQSGDMLAVADKKACENGLNILFLEQKMQQLELYGTVDSIISVFDSINYVLKADELLQVFKRVKNYLNKGGSFIFDVNTPYKYKRVLGHNTFAEAYRTCSYIWENQYDSKRRINEYAFNLFVETDDGLYQKTTEYHYQRAYSQRMLKALLRKAGFSDVNVFNAYTFDKPKFNSERIFFTARG